MKYKYIDYELNESDYFIWCLLNQLETNDKKINNLKQNLINLLKSKLFDIDNKKSIKDIQLFIRLYY